MKRIFGFRSKKIVFKNCIPSEHRKFVESWLRYISFGELKRYSDLTVILERLGIKMPIEVYLWGDNDVYFHSDGKRYRVTLLRSSGTSIIVEENNSIIREYEVFYDSMFTLRKARVMEGEYKDSKRLESDYTQLVKWTYELSFDGGYRINLLISEPEKVPEGKERLLHRNYRQVEQYLLSLTPTSDVNEIYSNLKAVMNLTSDEIKSQETFRISLEHEKDGVNSIYGLIEVSNGKISKYTWKDSSEVFTICQNGDWSYIDEGRFEFSYINGKQKVAVIGDREEVEEYKFSVRLQYVEDRILDMRLKKGML